MQCIGLLKKSPQDESTHANKFFGKGLMVSFFVKLLVIDVVNDFLYCCVVTTLC